MRNFLFFLAGFVAAAFAVMLYVIFGKSSRRRDRLDRPDRIVLTEIVLSNSNKITGEFSMFELKEGQRVKLKFTAKTRRGNPAAVENLRVTSSDESVIGVSPVDGEEGAFYAEGLDGSANEAVLIEARGDADLGEGVKEIVGTTSGVCTQGEAFTFDIEVGEVEDVPVPETEAAEGGDVNGGPETEATPAGDGSADAGSTDAERVPGES